jgi:peptide/nickel transport system substrate-binding protein
MKRVLAVFSLLIVASMVLAACAPAATQTQPPAATEAPAATAAPAATEAPTAVPTVAPTTRHGGWLDEIDYSVVDAQSVITQIGAGAVDLFSYGLASDKLKDIKAANLCYSSSYGTTYSLIFNPAVFSDKTKLNPFSNPKIREAVNYLVDRNYINQEVYAGGVLPKWNVLATGLVDYTSVIDVARGLEAKYAYNPDKAKQIITTEMQGMGATLGSDGKWQFNGQPVNVEFLIRNDGDGTRLPMGEYAAKQLESVGFTVNHHQGKSSELSPLWIQSNPPDGKWNIYTGGWGSNGLQRDEKIQFRDMYLPDSLQGIPLFGENKPDPAFQKLGDDLANGNFTTLDQRHQMMTDILPLSLQDSLQVWLVDTQTYAPFKCDLQVSADVGAGVETTQMAPFNLRVKGQEGGVVKSGSTDTLFTDPWNPVNGSNWVTSAFVQNAVQGRAFMPDPYTGLSWPLRAEKADVTVQSGLPVSKSLDWVTLTTADKIDVPADAWVDWNAKTQTFIPASEKFPDGTTAKTKVTITYPADLFKTVKWHDGSNLSMADFIMGYIMAFDEGKKDSPIYDEDIAPITDAFLSHFKGIKIESTDPLVVTLYDDNFYQDAELIASTQPVVSMIWPYYGFGEAPWQSIAIGNTADANKELAWGTGKADRNKVEWTSFIGGPSLDILAKDLDTAIAEKTIPYAPTLSQYLTADEAVARYQALKDFYGKHKLFWDGTGPYYLDSVDLNGFSAVVKNNPDYPDLADRWAAFGEAPLGAAALEGPANVTIGQDAVFNATITYKSDGSPYPSADIKEVKFLVYDDTGATVYVGAGVAGASDGLYTLTIPADVTSKLAAGAGKIEAAAVFIPVAIPAFATADYVVTP